MYTHAANATQTRESAAQIWVNFWVNFTKNFTNTREGSPNLGKFDTNTKRLTHRGTNTETRHTWREVGWEVSAMTAEASVSQGAIVRLVKGIELKSPERRKQLSGKMLR